MSALQLLLAAVAAWLDRREREALAYLIEENRLLRRQLDGRRLRLTDDDHRRLAVRAYRLGRQALRDVATIVTPDTLLRWHRQLIARKWTYAKNGLSRRGVLAEIAEYVKHYHRERNHQGLADALIAGAPATGTVVGHIRRRPRLGGLLN